MKRKPSGILKSDPIKNRKPSGLSIDLKSSKTLDDEYSPPSSVSPQLSVTWASQVHASSSDNEKADRVNLINDAFFGEDKLIEMKTPECHSSSRSQESVDEDYSASLNAIIKRKASIKKKRGSKRNRRASSPVSQINMGSSSGDRRRSSVYTTSSGETAVTLDDGKDDSTQDRIFENIRLHKEVLQSVKMEPWSMKRKLKLVKQAKSYVVQHEGVLQEHFTSRTAKSLLTQFNIFLATKWRQILREVTNLSTYLIPWESRIKEIESHFGSVVASYFTFLRWLFWVNIVISFLLVLFVMMPEEIYVNPDRVKCDIRKTMSHQELAISSNFSTIWEFEGRLKYSALFYGYYSTFSGAITWGYNLPLAYFLTGLVVYIYSFVATLKKMAKNSRMSKLSSKDDEYVFAWKLFTGWDYMIGHTETSQNRMASIILGFKEALLEEAEKKKDTRNWRIILLRITVNFIILGLLAVSAFAVVHVVKRSMDIKETDSWWTRNEITIAMSLITFFFPMIFEALGLLEYYHPRKQLRIQLARIMVLNLLNLYSLIFALFDKISHMTEELRRMKPSDITSDGQCLNLDKNQTYNNYSILAMAFYTDHILKPMSLSLSQDSSDTSNNCYKFFIKCPTQTTINAAIFTMLFANISSLMHPSSDAPNIDLLDSNFITPPYVTSDDINSSVITESSTSTYSYDEYSHNIADEEFDYEDYLAQRMRNLPNDQFEDIPINKRDINISSLYDQFNLSIQSTAQSMTTNEFVELVTQVIHNDLETTDSSDFLTMTYTELYTYVTEKYDEFLESYYYSDEDDNKEENMCYQWVCKNTTEPTSEFPPSSVLLEDANTHDYSTEDVTQATQTTVTADKELKSPRETKFKNADIRTLCWETMFGQELAKLTIMDLLVTIFSTMTLDFIRALFVRYMNNIWCWDLEKVFPKYGDFKIAENILHLVNNQGMVWMGMFFSPGLAVINIFKLIIIMYLRSWTVLTCNVPHEVVFRASRSNNFYFALLLTMLFLCVLPVSYAIVFLEPSWHCGPFSQSNRIYHLLTNATENIIPDAITKYIVSPAAIIPLLLLLILIIYYLISLTGSLREANQDLKIQLRKERTEERRKMFKMATNQHCQQNEGINGLSDSWHKVLDSTQQRIHSISGDDNYSDTAGSKNRQLLQRMMKKALVKQQTVTEPCKANKDSSNLNDRLISEDTIIVPFATECAQDNRRTNKNKPNQNDNAPLPRISFKTISEQKTSKWVEKIPVITISKTSSDECVIDSDVEDCDEIGTALQ
ncbi:transmembrane channel-like protein [Ochlerotatus camptorhynchus]|uniref:transmembrane channel-like protein n=1 Tax=Ochlerotatus camptorhynchus TaxID=644619 RepID=UPI0031D8444F